MNNSGKENLSAVIISKNEECNIRGCLNSISWAREIVVVDDESTDQTAEIARSYNARVITRKMDVEGRQRNFAYAQATQPWILSLDADERVSPELALEIRKVVSNGSPHVAGYAIPIKTFIGTRWIRYAGYYPARKLRLHRKGKFRYEEAGVHPRAFLDGSEKPLEGDILHYGYRDFEHFVSKLNAQTTLEAQKWIGDGRRINGMKVTYKMLDRFLRHYIGKQGFRDGFVGFTLSASHALYQLFTYAKYLEIKAAGPQKGESRID